MNNMLDSTLFTRLIVYERKQLALWQMRNRLREFLIASSHNSLRKGGEYEQSFIMYVGSYAGRYGWVPNEDKGDRYS